MRKRATVPHLVLAAMLLLATVVMCQSNTKTAREQASFGNTGQIRGKLTDIESGEAIIGASVQIMGTKQGAQSDFDGYYCILQVTSGTYRIRITAVGYTAVEVTEVIVVADSTSQVDVQLKKDPSDIGVTIEVKAKQDIIEKFEVSNTTTINKSPIKGRKMVMSSGIPAACAEFTPGGNPPAHGGTSIVNNEPFDAMFFKNYGVNPFVDTEDDHLSTFAVDVDDASFVMARSYLNRGAMPPDEAIRTEEFVNHFEYGYAAPDKSAFAIYADGAPTPFGPSNSLALRIGIKGFEVDPKYRKDANLVFVIDVSGSMNREDRLTLVKKALRLLVDELTPSDQIGIVVYGSRGQVVLQPTGLGEKREIIAAIERLVPNGSTNAEEGIQIGYEMADRCFEPGKINRVILCSDGVANVGRTGPDQILKQIKQYADKGITLSAIGFGMGNFNDVLMEKLGNKGNGYYAYVDNLEQARKIFVDNLTGSLQVIARDVKIQVDFDPEVVRSYRLLGYENRDVRDQDFRVDSVDGGEIGSGHQVTALYEIKLHKNDRSNKKLATVFVRYKDADDMSEVTEVRRDIRLTETAVEFSESSSDFRLAVAAAEFAEILRKSYWAKESQFSSVLDLVQDIAEEERSSELIEFMGLVSKADDLDKQLAGK